MRKTVSEKYMYRVKKNTAGDFVYQINVIKKITILQKMNKKHASDMRACGFIHNFVVFNNFQSTEN